MRSVVLLPQPDGPTSTTNSLIGNVEIDAADGVDIVVALDHVTQCDFRHNLGPVVFVQPLVAPAVRPAM